ncbi:hypothetical protein AAG906_025172 [Vitis piasezkii]
MQNPTKVDWKAVKRVLRYLKGSVECGIHLKPSKILGLIAFSDADWGSCPHDEKPESYDHKRYRHEPVEPGGVLRVLKSQGAEVGALVLMLKTVAPLCQDLSETWNKNIQPPDQISEALAVQAATSSRVASFVLVFSKTTADALEELKGYKDMKNVLIKQGLRSQTSTNLALAAEVSSRGTTG